MSRKISQIKTSSRNILLGHYAMIIAAIFAMLLILLVLNLPFRNLLFRGILQLSVLRIIAGIAGVLLVAMAFMLFNSGFAWIHLSLARGRDVRFRDVFHPFTNQPGKFVGFGLLRIATAMICLQPALICLVLSVDVSLADFSYQIVLPAVWYICNLLMLAGIIVFVVILMSWSYAACLLLEHREMSVMQAIRESRHLLRGKKRRRFALMLSFIGLLFLSVLSFFIALLWIIPYMRQSFIYYYLDLEQ